MVLIGKYRQIYWYLPVNTSIPSVNKMIMEVICLELFMFFGSVFVLSIDHYIIHFFLITQEKKCKEKISIKSYASEESLWSVNESNCEVSEVVCVFVSAQTLIYVCAASVWWCCSTSLWWGSRNAKRTGHLGCFPWINSADIWLDGDGKGRACKPQWNQHYLKNKQTNI